MYYIVRKCIVLLMTLFFISLATFGAFHVIAGDPALLILETEASEERLALLRAELGTDKPLLTQYCTWVRKAMRGDWGMSLTYRVPVADLLRERLSVTGIIGGLSFFCVIVFGIPLGIVAARKKKGWQAIFIHVMTVLGMSIPEFFFSILVIWIFGLGLHAFVPGQYVGYQGDVRAFFSYIIFPVFTIAVPQIAIVSKYVREAVLAEQNAGYVRTARSKGNSEVRILYVHILKNALVVVMPLLGMVAGNIFSGSIIVEQVYGIPGLGRLLIAAVTSRDFPLAQAIVLFIALLVVFINFCVDILVQLLDPRIRLQG